MTEFKLRFPEPKFAYWAKRYSYTENDGDLVNEVGPAARERGYVKRAEFLDICKWKTRRSQSKCAKNSERAIRTITKAALATSDETLKMELLRLLDGVEWPTASTILHFCDRQSYPILDFRALWSLGFAKPPHYTMTFWLEYLEFTRSLSTRLKLPIRTIDRALWQYSKEKQRKTR